MLLKNVTLLEYCFYEMKLWCKKQNTQLHIFVVSLWDNGLQKLRMPLHFAKFNPLICTLVVVI